MEKLERFSIRKLTVGVTSVAIGFWFVSNTQRVYADTLSTSMNKSLELKSSSDAQTGNQNQISQSVETVTNSDITDTKTGVNDSKDHSLMNADDKVSHDTIPIKSEDSDIGLNLNIDSKQTIEAQNVEASSRVLNAENNQVSNKSTNVLNDTIQKGVAAKNNITNAQLRQSFIQTSKSTSEVDQVKNNAVQTAQSTDNNYQLYMDNSDWGNTPNGKNPIKLLLSGSTKAGDTVLISIPKIVPVTAPNLDANYGSISQYAQDQTQYIKINFKTDAVVNPVFTLRVDNGYAATETPIQNVSDYMSKIKWTVNGIDEPDLDLHIAINPEWKPKFTRLSPASDGASGLAKLIPDTQIVYSFSVSEDRGVTYNFGYAASLINSAVNYGSVITIPMPKGFKFDSDTTKKLNNFKDATQITQENNNIIITVPKGSGVQSWNSPPFGYRIAGSYDVELTDKEQTITANSPITIVQKLNDDGSLTKNFTGEPVKAVFYGKTDSIPLGNIKQVITPGYEGGVFWDNQKEQLIGYFGIENTTLANYDNYSASFTLQFHNEFGVNKVKTPTMDNVKNYKYEVHYADGSTNSGIVNAGETIHGEATKIISKIVISPDTFNIGAKTELSMPNNQFILQEQKDVNAFEAFGVINNPIYSVNQVFDFIFTGTGRIGSMFQTTTQTTRGVARVLNPEDRKTGLSPYTPSYNNLNNINIGDIGIQRMWYVNTERYLDEPVLYYVIPAGYSADSNLTIKSDTLRGEPKVSAFVVNNSDGSQNQVIKIDYSGTDYQIDLAKPGAIDLIHTTSVADLPMGDHYGAIYVISPKTKLVDANKLYTDTNKATFGLNNGKFNPDFVENNLTNLYQVGSFTYTTKLVGGANTVSVAKGNMDAQFANTGASDIYGSPNIQFGFSLRNNIGTDLQHVVSVVNLPQESNTSFTFELTKPLNVDDSEYTVLYSTDAFDTSKVAYSFGEKPDETGYVTADKVADWSKIKSLIIKTDLLRDGTQSNRFVLNGIVKNLVRDVGKVGSLSSVFYSDTTKPLVSNQSGSIKITGDANILYKLHYVDEEGVEHTVDLPSLNTKIAADGKTSLGSKSAQLKKVSNDDTVKQLLGDKYFLQSVTISNGGKSWQTDDVSHDVLLGEPVEYYFNNAVITVNAVLKQTSVGVPESIDKQALNIVNYIDDDGNLVKIEHIVGVNGDKITVTIPDGYHVNGKVPDLVVNSEIPVHTINLIKDKIETDTPEVINRPILNIINYVDKQGKVIKTDHTVGDSGDKITVTIPDGYHADGNIPVLTITGDQSVHVVNIVKDEWVTGDPLTSDKPAYDINKLKKRANTQIHKLVQPKENVSRSTKPAEEQPDRQVRKLPQAGVKQSLASIIVGVISTVLAALGLTKRKKDE